MEKRMKIGSLLIAFALVASLTLAVPALASPEFGWVPGTYSIDSAAGSQIETTMSIYAKYLFLKSETQVENIISDLENKMHFVVVYGSCVDGICQITIPKENFSCEPFYITTVTLLGYTVQMWGELSMKTDGSGQLACGDNLLDVDVSVEITGDSGTYTVDTTIGDGTPDPAGSAIVYVEMSLKVTNGEGGTELVTLQLPMYLTTGTVYIHVTDTTPYPSGSTKTLHCKSLSCTGTPHDPTTGAATLVGVTGALDVYSKVFGVLDTWTDFISQITLVIPPLV